ncbi:MAG: hypothetical protein AVDCRST_MAG05-4133, partial [uncultured Rubrobacteraceae bacterium]
GREAQGFGGGARRGRGHARAVGAEVDVALDGPGLRHRPDAGGRPRGGGVYPGGVLAPDPAGAGRSRARGVRRQHRGRLRAAAPGTGREKGRGRRRLLARYPGLGGGVGELAAAHRRPLAPVEAAEHQGIAARHRPRGLRRGVGPDLLRPHPHPQRQRL